MTKPMFAKRHYEAIALAMQEVYLDADGSSERHCAVDSAVRRLCTEFERDNASFDRERFIRACVPGANVRART